MSSPTYAYFEHDNAYFRRREPARNWYTPVDDVLNERTGKWVPYTGDRSKPVLWGDRTDDPLPHGTAS